MTTINVLLRPLLLPKLPLTPLKQSHLAKMRSLSFSRNLELSPGSKRAKMLRSKPPDKKPPLSAPFLSEKSTEE